MKKINLLILLNTITLSFADGLPQPANESALITTTTVESSNLQNSYISPNNYLQNPYAGQAMGKSTQTLTESQISGTANEGFLQRLLEDGSYNAAAAGSAALFNGSENEAAGGYLWGQTGRFAGFALGGQIAVQTPQQSGSYQGYIYSQNILELSQAYLEYQYGNTVNLDLGRIMITSPWLNSTNPSTTAFITYQGGWLNIQPLSNLLISTFGISDMGNPAGFHPYNLYNSSFGYQISTTGSAPGAIGLGLQWTATPSYNVNLWGYQFYDYANMLYADNKYTLNFSDKFNMTFAAQAATEAGQGSNTLNNPQYTATPYGTVNSNILGAQIGLTYDIWSLTLGFDSIFGSGSYGNGGFVSPYTYQILSDPLYTTSQIAGMIEKASSGNSYKIAPSLSLLDKNLVITPQYAYYATTAVPFSQEFDFVTQYSIPQIRGLSIEGSYSLLMSTGSNPTQSSDLINAYQIFLQYLY